MKDNNIPSQMLIVKAFFNIEAIRQIDRWGQTIY